MINFPDNKQFAFTIVDDTDDAYLENIQPIYDLLAKNGIRTTKTVWVYPVRDPERSKGDSLSRAEYRDFVVNLKMKGFEIGLHNVGSGIYYRDEILEGLEDFSQKLGHKPRLHINHSYNPDNIYCGSKRFSFPFNHIVEKLYAQYSNFSGEIEGSEHFWGDVHKEVVDYSRNYEIDDINTLKKNPYMPYRDKVYDDFSNYWFSSTFAPNQWMFKKQVNKKSIDRLEAEGGICILYTHLGYYMKDGVIDPHFKMMIEYLGKKSNGWYAPVSDILDFLIEYKKQNNKREYLPLIFKKWLEFRSLWTRIKYRYLIKKDDYHFKQSGDYDPRSGAVNR